jgi:malate/lactate dehydrogenase
MNDKVTVIGAGRVESALATVLFHKGTATTVYVNVMERAIQAGKSQDDFACLFEILSDATSKPI